MEVVSLKVSREDISLEGSKERGQGWGLGKEGVSFWLLTPLMETTPPWALRAGPKILWAQLWAGQAARQFPSGANIATN